MGAAQLIQRRARLILSLLPYGIVVGIIVGLMQWIGWI